VPEIYGHCGQVLLERADSTRAGGGEVEVIHRKSSAVNPPGLHGRT